MERDFNKALDDSLDRLLLRNGSVEECLSRYPEHAKELEPMLRLALRLRQSSQQPVNEARKAAARSRLLQDISKQKRQAHQATHAAASRGWLGGLFSSYKRLAVTAAACFVALLMAATGTAAASLRSNPDDALYPMKRFTEEVQLTFAFSNGQKESLSADFADRRSAEMVALARKGETERVEGLQRDMERHLGKVRDLQLRRLASRLEKKGVEAPAVLSSLAKVLEQEAALDGDPVELDGPQAAPPVTATPVVQSGAQRPQPVLAGNMPAPVRAIVIIPGVKKPEVALEEIRAHRREQEALRKRLAEVAERRIERLQEALSTAPEQARAGLLIAIENVRRTYQEAILSTGARPPARFIDPKPFPPGREKPEQPQEDKPDRDNRGQSPKEPQQPVDDETRSPGFQPNRPYPGRAPNAPEQERKGKQPRRDGAEHPSVPPTPIATPSPEQR
ncbi:MAG: hypothetical protein HYX97_03280 [Chloroflexi bacterium]|nr:hypothetical protein [Chloroflexota bacterium]